MSDTSSKPLDEDSMSQDHGIDEGPASSDNRRTSTKRKPTGTGDISDLDVDMAGAPEMDTRTGTLKKPRLHSPAGPLTPTQVYIAPKDKSCLPREIWSHICLFTPPRALGNLLRVNKLFNTYLDPKSRFVMHEQPPPLNQSTAKPLDPNSIWRRARRAFWPKAPGPFKDMTELDIWRLACSTACQFCGKRPSRQQLPLSDPHRHGPGADGVAVIWEFRVRTCGACFSKKTSKEMDIILSTASTFLLPALPFVLANQDNIVIPLRVIEAGKLSPTETLSKLFWSSDVESLREEFLTVKELGPAAAGEWQKGLSLRGSKRSSEAAKWQKYDDAGGVADMRTLLQYSNVRLKAADHATVPAKITPQLPQAESLNDAVKAPFPTTEKTATAESAPATAQKTKEEIDAEWDEIQGPVRFKILKYADEAIIGDWDDGEKVNKKNAPSFASDVLLHVRKRFYKEVEDDAKTARAAGQEPVVDLPEGPFTQKLSLENMKYVFDVKIRPITGNLCKDLFLCNDCDYNGKFFGLEGVIQHFASKHTMVLSKGNIVVHWRAEWPEHSPFKAYPRRPKGAAQLALPAKPPSSHSTKNLPGRHDSRGPAQKHVLVTEDRRQLQPARPPLHPTDSLAQSATVPQHDKAQYYPAPPYASLLPNTTLPQPSTYPGGWPGDYTSPQYSQHSSQDHVGADAHRRDLELVPQRDDYPTQGNPPAYTVENVPTIGDGALPSRIRTPGSAYAGQGRSELAPAGPPAASDIDTEVKLNEIARHASSLWKATENMRSLPAPIRLFTVHFHLNNVYEERFGQPLSLALYMKALVAKEDLRPMVAGARLSCYACQLSPGGGRISKKGDGTHSIFELYKHFEDTHIRGTNNGHPSAGSLDWLTDMLILPTQKDMIRIAGRPTKRGKRFPLLPLALFSLSRKKRGRPLTRSAIRSARIQPEIASDLERSESEARTGQTQSSATIKREESSGPDSTETRLPQRNGSTAAVPGVDETDILGALEMHLDHPHSEHISAIHDDGRHFAGEERERAGYGRYADAQHNNGTRAPEVRGKLQEELARVDIASTSERAVKSHATQYRQQMPSSAHREQCGSAYGYDDRPPQQYPQLQRTSAPPPPPQHPQQYIYADRDGAYPGSYGEPARADFEPYEAYEVVRVVHPDGDYLVRRPLHRQAFEVVESQPARQYYRQAAPPVYGDAGRGFPVKPPNEYQHYAEPTAYVRARPPTDLAYEASHERMVAAPSRPTRESNPAPQHYYEEYDPHYRTATAGHQHGEHRLRDSGDRARHQPQFQ